MEARRVESERCDGRLAELRRPQRLGLRAIIQGQVAGGEPHRYNVLLQSTEVNQLPVSECQIIKTYLCSRETDGCEPRLSLNHRLLTQKVRWF